MTNPQVNSQIQDLYDDYYQGEQLFVKRELTATQTFSHIQDICDEEDFAKVIDIGAGEGSLLKCLDANSFAQNLYGVEISSSGIEAIKGKNLPRLREISSFDGYHIPYDDKFFDLAISIHVLEHVEHERMFLSEIKRVARRIVIEVPLEHTIFIDKAIRWCRPHGHINFYTVKTFQNLLETSGLRCLDMKIYPVSRELEIFASGKTKGGLKHFLRSGMLSVSPSLATSAMTYMCTAYCEV
jgi:ubiquinone/menaquinone biosynthesis C-methylase UbiE